MTPGSISIPPPVEKSVLRLAPTSNFPGVVVVIVVVTMSTLPPLVFVAAGGSAPPTLTAAAVGQGGPVGPGGPCCPVGSCPAAKSIAFRPPFFTFEGTTALALSCLVPTLFFGKTTAA